VSGHVILLGYSRNFDTEKRCDDVVTLAAAAAVVIVIRRRRRRRLQHRRLLWCKPWLQARDSDRARRQCVMIQLFFISDEEEARATAGPLGWAPLAKLIYYIVRPTGCTTGCIVYTGFKSLMYNPWATFCE